MEHAGSIERIIEAIDQDIQEALKPYQAQVDLLKTMPGVKDLAAASLIAELVDDQISLEGLWL